MKDCPVCHQPLRETPRYGVIVDVCPGCRGVWLDRGELEKVVALAREFRADDDDFDERRHKYDDKYYREHRDEYHGYHHKKKKKHGLFEVFGDLFD